ncbi:hypothetical protein B0T20DRAFT_472297 [Sordaria brevicollis]|uniref:HMA domain-containing protein n=1 Tax=Sordaria brevicollis TaxID=83679 RepID=A0AAE0P3D5_SORBR|nr:hypothetical protein B0T20DRAFT_472297 [Sordaria brevicollis]
MPYDHHLRFHITMSCGGCSGAVRKVLNKQPAVKPFEEDQPKADPKWVDVYTDGTISLAQVKEIIAKTGKQINYYGEVRDGEDYEYGTKHVKITKDLEDPMKFTVEEVKE